jgi:NO-binding membrane sensor protein with MHYT domain
MKPILILVFLPVLVGVVANALLRNIRSAALGATIGAPIAVFLCLRALDPDGTWSWLAALLVAPLVIAMSLVTVLLWFGRSRARTRSSWNGA